MTLRSRRSNSKICCFRSIASIMRPLWLAAKRPLDPANSCGTPRSAQSVVDPRRARAPLLKRSTERSRCPKRLLRSAQLNRPAKDIRDQSAECGVPATAAAYSQRQNRPVKRLHQLFNALPNPLGEAAIDPRRQRPEIGGDADLVAKAGLPYRLVDPWRRILLHADQQHDPAIRKPGALGYHRASASGAQVKNKALNRRLHPNGPRLWPRPGFRRLARPDPNNRVRAQRGARPSLNADVRLCCNYCHNTLISP